MVSAQFARSGAGLILHEDMEIALLVVFGLAASNLASVSPAPLWNCGIVHIITVGFTSLVLGLLLQAKLTQAAVRRQWPTSVLVLLLCPVPFFTAVFGNMVGISVLAYVGRGHVF
uniref:Uncharacterized protein n=1 Tax=Haptolina brevifila TaxID=156173 RepID=A0A7S2NHL3_9EUKA|mmetsp:Transcript_77650/g.154253  ORF Transcript_77650/g.154253 Transcript_77650/m.154253 type:complete len:115 (+) Transcript_77650:218-562(+)